MTSVLQLQAGAWHQADYGYNHCSSIQPSSIQKRGLTLPIDSAYQEPMPQSLAVTGSLRTAASRMLHQLFLHI